MNISLNTFKGIRILVVGDVMLDRYVCGDVTRISPEAPVPVLSVLERRAVLGGAANVAANLAGLGCSAALWGVTGKDTRADEISYLLNRSGVDSFLQKDEDRPTTSKTRVVSRGQQIVRFDEELSTPLNFDTEDKIFQSLKPHIAKAHAIILSDYNKGVFQGELAPQIIESAYKAGKLIFVDPKGNNWDKYKGAFCVTPNEKEVFQFWSHAIEQGLNSHAEAVRRKFNIKKLLVTQGAKGMTLFTEEEKCLLPPPDPREVFDVSGAGDTVVAVLAAAMAVKMPGHICLSLANTAAGVVIAKSGTSPITAEELVAAEKKDRGSKICALAEGVALVKLWQKRSDKVVFTNGCFDLLHPGHIQLLRSAAAEGDRLIVGLNSDESVKRLKGPDRPVLSQGDRATILSALDCVDMVIIFPEDTPLNLIRALKPQVLVKGGDYTPETVVGRDFVEENGGRIVIVPLVQGKSTTGILNLIQN